MSSPTTLILACSSILGLGTWIGLNRRDVRGDYAFLTFTAGFASLFLGYRLGSSNDSTPVEDFYKSAQVASVYTATLTLATIFYRLSPFHPLSSFPGPILWRITCLRLVASSFRGYRHLTIDSLHKKYGRFVRIGPNHLSLNSPSAAAALYSTSIMEKSHSYDPPGHIAGVSLFFKHTREEHTARKRIWYSAFTGSAFIQYCYPMDKRVWQLIQLLQDRTGLGNTVDLAECLAHWSYDFMGEMVFGGSNNLELMKDGDKENLVDGGKMAMKIVDSFGQAPWLFDILWHLPASQDIHKLRIASNQMMVNRAKSENVDIQDVLSYLLAGDPTTGEHIPDSELASEALVAIQAGSDNTATLLGLAFFFLLSNRPLYKKLERELDQHFPDPKGSLEISGLSELSYLNAVIHETQRLGTPFFLPRIVPPEGVIIDSIQIPRDTVVVLAAHTQQTSEENFGPDPLVFRPERWLDEEGATLNKSALVSFSSGRFVCVAKTFAMHELRFVLARLILNLDIKLAPGFDADQFRRGIRNMRTTVFDHPLTVTVESRHGGS